MRVKPEYNGHHYNGGYKPKDKPGTEKCHGVGFIKKQAAPGQDCRPSKQKPTLITF